MAEEPLLPGRPYLAEDRRQDRLGATITELKYKINVNTLEHLAAKQLELNEIGVCNIASTSRSRSTPTPRTATPAASS
jgi:bifunctional enzyme CysN/CysC